MAAEAEQITSKPVAEATETVKDEEDPEADAGAIAEDDQMPVKSLHKIDSTADIETTAEKALAKT